MLKTKSIVLLVFLAAIVDCSASTKHDRAVALVKQAESAYQQGRYERAIDLCHQANQADATYVRAFTWLGAIYVKQNKPHDALLAYRRVVELAPKSDDAKLARTWIEHHDAV